jgi:hypothetical protein
MLLQRYLAKSQLYCKIYWRHGRKETRQARLQLSLYNEFALIIFYQFSLKQLGNGITCSSGLLKSWTLLRSHHYLPYLVLSYCWSWDLTLRHLKFLERKVREILLAIILILFPFFGLHFQLLAKHLISTLNFKFLTFGKCSKSQSKLTHLSGKQEAMVITRLKSLLQSQSRNQNFLQVWERQIGSQNVPLWN